MDLRKFHLKSTEFDTQKYIALLETTLESTVDGILVVDLSGKIIKYNSMFTKLWKIPEQVMISHDDKEALSYVISQLSDPHMFLRKVSELYLAPEMESFDVLHFKDRRVFERYSRPQFFEGRIIGRVWSFRDTTERYWMEKALRESEQRLKVVVNHSPIVLFSFDQKGVFTFCEGKEVEKIGITTDQVVGRSIYEFCKEEPKILPLVTRALAGEPSSAVVEIRGLAWQTNYLPIKGTCGNITSVMGTSTNVTKLVKLEKELNRLLIAERNASSQAQVQNRRSEFLVGLGHLLTKILRSDILMKSLVEYCIPTLGDWMLGFLFENDLVTLKEAAHFHLEEGEILKSFQKSKIRLRVEGEVFKSLSTGVIEEYRNFDFEKLFKMDDRRDYEKLQLLGSSAVLVVPLCRREKVFGALVFVSASHPERYNSDEIELAMKVSTCAALTIDNAIMYEKSQSAIGAREDFISVASHELKTPLTSLRMQLDLIRKLVSEDGKGPPVDSRIQQLITGCGKEVDRFARLVGTLLDLTKIRTGKLTLTIEEVDLSELVFQVIDRLKPELVRSRCEVYADVAPFVKGTWDRFRLDQVITNLMTNAMKFGRNKPIFVKLIRLPRSVILSVRDQGIGIAPENQKKIFERFERAVAERSFGGMGLGLYITREIIYAHKGEVRVTSKLGEGSEFSVELPI